MIGPDSLFHNSIGSASWLEISLMNTTGQLRYLQSINLRRNHLQDLPVEFGELRELQYLVLSFNRLQRLPGSCNKL